MTTPRPGIFLFPAFAVAIFAPGMAFACSPDDIKCYWNLAMAENRALDLPAFSAAVDDARRALAQDPTPTAEDRAVVLRLEGLEAAMAQDRAAAIRLFQAARALDPAATLPEDLYPPTHPFARLYATALPTEPAPLLVQGPMPAVDPPVTSMTSVTPPPPRRGAPWLLAAAGSAALSGGLYAWSRHLPDPSGAYGDDALSYAQAQAQTFGRRDALQAGSGGAALLSLGLVTAGVTVVW